MSCSRWTYTHISKEIAGDLSPSYIPSTHTNTHAQTCTLYIGASKNISALSPPQCTIRHIKTEIKTHPHTHAQRAVAF